MVNQAPATGLFLGPIGGFITWLEDLVVLLSGWMIGLGLMIGLMYLFSDGQISVGAGWVIGAWVVFSAMGIEGQLVGTFYRLRVAMNAKNWFEAAFYLVLGAILCYVAYVAASVFTMTQAFNLSIDQALALQGINKVDWINQRIIVLIALAALSGLQRFADPKRQPQPLTPEQIDQQIERENALARLKATQAANSGNTFRARIAGLTGQAALGKPVVTATTSTAQVPIATQASAGAQPTAMGNSVAASDLFEQDDQDNDDADAEDAEDLQMVLATSGSAISNGNSAHMAPIAGSASGISVKNGNSSTALPTPVRKKPLVAGTNRAFVAALRDANNRLIQRNEATSLFNLARELNAEGIGPAEIKMVLDQLNEQRINSLKPNRQLAYDALLDGVSLT